jgi:RNA polymerase sigma-70 factor (ECF subfamily)
VADRFQTTHWSLVLAAARGGEGSAAALEWLCGTYWYPLYAFIRRQGHDAEAARDLTQSFFLHLIEKSALHEIDPRLGKFRAFLLACIKNFLADQREREAALKRRGDHPSFRLGLEDAERRYLGEQPADLSPEELFERRWARAILDRAVRRLGEEHVSAGKADVFSHLRGHLTGEESPYEGLAAKLGTTEGALRVAVHRMRQRLGALLREEVAQTVSTPADIDEELRQLLQAAGRGG